MTRPSSHGRRCLLVTTAVCLLGFAACGQPAVQLAGKVTNGTRPLPGAAVRLVSKGRSPEVFIGGMTDENGELRLDTSQTGGVPAGKYEITVSWWVLTRTGKPLPPGEEGDTLKGTDAARQFVVTFDREITPTTTTLDLDVKDGDPQQAGRRTPVQYGQIRVRSSKGTSPTPDSFCPQTFSPGAVGRTLATQDVQRQGNRQRPRVQLRVPMRPVQPGQAERRDRHAGQRRGLTHDG